MTISRVKPAGWAANEKLTSAQMTAVDLNTSYALDKRSGQTDSLAARVSLATGGRLVKLVQAGADADGTYEIGDGTVIKIPDLNIAVRTYTLSTSGAVAGDIIELVSDPLIGNAFGCDVVNGGAGGGTLMRVGPGGQGYHLAALFDGTNWIPCRGWHWGLYAEAFSSDGSWVCPAGVRTALVVASGGGGGGGGGKTGSASTGNYAGGGGGGGGAQLFKAHVFTTPGTSYSVDIGAGGAGGAPNAPGSAGSPTRLYTGSTFLLVAPGAGGGAYHSIGHTPATSWLLYALGGDPVDGVQEISTTPANPGIISVDTTSAPYNTMIHAWRMAPGAGGAGRAGFAGQSGGPCAAAVDFSTTLPAGGGGGGVGADVGSYRGGGGGGGGGAGPWGSGGAGGGGGAGHGTTGVAGSAGTAAAASTGAGGGGGGGGGAGPTPGAGGSGGAGAAGRMVIIYQR